MTRRFVWISMAALLAVASAAEPWSNSAAEAGPGVKAAAPAAVAPCKDEVSALRVQLADAQAQNALLQQQLDRLQLAERTRLQKLQAQLGSPMIEKLH